MKESVRTSCCTSILTVTAKVSSWVLDMLTQQQAASGALEQWVPVQ